MFGLFALIGLMGLGIQGGGLALSYINAQKANEEAQKQQALEIAANKSKENQMQLEAQRQRREVVRRQVAAQAQATATATSEGAQFGSGLAGATGQAANQTAFAMGGINSATSVGEDLFQNSNLISASRGREAGYRSNMQLGAGLTSLGGSMTSEAGTFSKLMGLF